jgi:hypothetical protein
MQRDDHLERYLAYLEPRLPGDDHYLKCARGAYAKYQRNGLGRDRKRAWRFVQKAADRTGKTRTPEGEAGRVSYKQEGREK